MVKLQVVGGMALQLFLLDLGQLILEVLEVADLNFLPQETVLLAKETVVVLELVLDTLEEEEEEGLVL
jgi:hypothetical protein